jgi:hypothetical protein
MALTSLVVCSGVFHVIVDLLSHLLKLDMDVLLPQKKKGKEKEKEKENKNTRQNKNVDKHSPGLS